MKENILNFIGHRATVTTSGGHSISFRCLAWPRCARQLRSDAKFHQTCSQDAPLFQPLPSAGPLQRWSGEDWHVYRTGYHAWENERGRHSERLRLCEIYSSTTCSHGSNFGKTLKNITITAAIATSIYVWCACYYYIFRHSTFLFMTLWGSTYCVEKQKSQPTI